MPDDDDRLDDGFDDYESREEDDYEDVECSECGDVVDWANLDVLDPPMCKDCARDLGYA